ncbi:TPA: hypothetical protein QDB06_000850 [Burkholderia vietnamiensis]|nr:hypothetical protein [Burkholderia vietnamiensis]
MKRIEIPGLLSKNALLKAKKKYHFTDATKKFFTDYYGEAPLLSMQPGWNRLYSLIKDQGLDLRLYELKSSKKRIKIFKDKNCFCQFDFFTYDQLISQSLANIVETNALKLDYSLPKRNVVNKKMKI